MATEYKLSYTASEIDEKLGKVDEHETSISQLSEEIVNLKQTTPSGESALTIAQVDALDGMFKKCAFTGDVTAEYTAFKQAFGIESGNGEEPDKPTTPTLTSISATYTGGEVTEGTALTDLTGITVTAHYSDGSTANVTGYTLSGTITEGNNTITVSYGSKTTTFTVTGVAESSGDEPTSLAGYQLETYNGTADDNWGNTGFSGTLNDNLGMNKGYYKRLLKSGTYYIRGLMKSVFLSSNVCCIDLTDNVDYMQSPTVSEDLALEFIRKFSYEGETDVFVHVDDDGVVTTHTGYPASDDTNTLGGFIVVSKFVVPEGKYGIIHTPVTRWLDGYVVIFTSDPSENITLTEIEEAEVFV